MIKQKDVITLFVPFPNISSELAVKSHMYICYSANNKMKKLIKCQTFKLNMVTNNLVRHCVCEDPDIKRNPFTRRTLIDCDKLFSLSVVIPTSLKTTIRPDICNALYLKIATELIKDGYDEHEISTNDILKVNGRLRRS